MLVGEVASCVEGNSGNESNKGGNNEDTGGDKSGNGSAVKYLSGLPGKDLTAR